MNEPLYDLSDLSGDPTPCTLASFLDANAECPPDAREVQAMRLASVCETVYLSIGGGVVRVRRVL